ncbi:electron transporter RnfC, partial [Cronobacter dublinensis subsp. dublinensis]|nr:electron transporter RnfC [Cronobacter dublinensis subsp. dublinensis]
RKAAQAGERAPVAEAPAEPVDPRKAAVEAAIARAKARKAAQADERARAANEEDDADSARKAAVAAAIARVQARKAADKVVNED